MTNPQDIPPEVVERMIGFVRNVSEMTTSAMDDLEEARAIAALLPEPVDPDLLEAKAIVKEAYPEMRADYAGRRISIALAAIKRGRDLERSGK